MNARHNRKIYDSMLRLFQATDQQKQMLRKALLTENIRFEVEYHHAIWDTFTLETIREQRNLLCACTKPSSDPVWTNVDIRGRLPTPSFYIAHSLGFNLPEEWVTWCDGAIRRYFETCIMELRVGNFTVFRRTGHHSYRLDDIFIPGDMYMAVRIVAPHYNLPCHEFAPPGLARLTMLGTYIYPVA